VSLNDFINFNLLERIVSRDLNDLQSLSARTLGNTLRYLLSQRDIINTNGSTTSRDVVLGGLNVSSPGIANTARITPGIAVQFSTSLLPLPTTFDSPYRLGWNDANVDLVAPVLGANMYYLLETQVVRVLTSTQSRDIKNVGTGLYVPTNVPKEYSFELDFRYRAGTATDAPAVTAGWIPLAIVFRPAGGGPLTSAQIVNVARQWGDQNNPGAARLNVSGRFTVEAFPFGTNEDAVRIDTDEIGYRRNQPFYAFTETTADLTTAPYLEPGTALAAGNWYYVYMCPWQGLVPKNAYPGVLYGEGLVVLSAQPPFLAYDYPALLNPVGGGAQRTNLSNITAPAPYAAGPIFADSAMCIGALLRNAANTGWVRTTREGSWTILADTAEYPVLGTLATDGVGPLFTNINLSVAGGLFSARSVRLKIHIPQGSGAADYSFVISVRNTGGGGPVYAQVAGNLTQGVLFQTDAIIDVPLRSTGPAFALTIQNILGPANAASDIELIGFAW
jgi:hypothetical protein